MCTVCGRTVRAGGRAGARERLTEWISRAGDWDWRDGAPLIRQSNEFNLRPLLSALLSATCDF